MLKNLRVRTKLIAVLAVPLAGLIIMATIGVLDRQAQASQARDGRTLAELTGARVELAHQLQLERQWTAAAMSGARTFGAAELATQRQATDAAAVEFAGRAKSARKVTGEVDKQTDAILADLDGLAARRQAIDNGDAIQQVAMDGYALALGNLSQLADAVALASRDTDLSGDVASLVALGDAKESIGAIGATVAETLEEGQWREFEFDAVVNGRSRFDADMLRFVGLADSDSRDQLRTVDSRPETLAYDTVLGKIIAGGATNPAFVSNAEWAAASSARLANLRELEEFVTTSVADAAKQIESDATAAERQYLLGALAAVFVSLLLASLVARSIARPLTKLTAGAYQLSEHQLPALVEQLRNPTSEHVGANLEHIAIDSTDEIGQLANAFNSIQDVTKEVATEQAALLRKGIGDIFVNLARRNQTLLDRQIEFIDQLEAREEDPDQLENLFKLDHLATRMRRNAESLLVLAGAEAPRRRGRPVDMTDVVRVAIGEVEQFARITLLALDDANVSATVAVDLAHLLSELMENATQFSPPETHVEIVGHKTRDGNYVISISDQGIGMTPDQLNESNRLMANPPVVGLALSRSLGFIVIGRLAARFGIGVRLTSSPAGGVSALVSLPNTLIDMDAAVAPSTEPIEPISFTPHAQPEALAPAASPSPSPSQYEAPASVVEPAHVAEPVAFVAEPEPAHVEETAPPSEAPTPISLGLTPIVEMPLQIPADWIIPPAETLPSQPNPAANDLPPLPTRMRSASTDTAPPDIVGPAMAPPPPPPAMPMMAPPVTPMVPPLSAAPPVPTMPASGEVLPPLPTRRAPEQAPDTAASAVTAGGLTRRVPKAVMPNAAPTPSAPVSATQRSPEEVRLMLSRYRSGLRRGRHDQPQGESQDS